MGVTLTGRATGKLCSLSSAIFTDPKSAIFDGTGRLYETKKGTYGYKESLS